MNLFEPKTYSKKLGELISSVAFFPRGELIPGSKLIRDTRVFTNKTIYFPFKNWLKDFNKGNKTIFFFFFKKEFKVAL